MKCNACYTDNLNEAQYCKNCGRQLRLASTKSASVTIPIVLCIGIFIASAVICGRKIAAVAAVKSVDSDQFTLCQSNILHYYNAEKGRLVVKAKGENGFSEYSIKVKEPSEITEGKNCALVTAGSKQYFLTETKAYRVKNSTRIQLAELAPVCAYLNAKGELFKISDKGEVLAADKVLDFSLAANGDLYYFRDDMSEAAEEGKGYDRNSVYLDSKVICTDSTDDPISELVGANAFGVYFRTKNGSLMVSPNSPDSSGSKFEFTDFSELVLISNASVIAQKTDGSTYIWAESNDEVQLSEHSVTGIVVPEGYTFTGDTYGGLIYTTADDAFYTDSTGKCTYLECGNAHDLKTAGDCTYLYYLDAQNTLIRKDASGMHKDRVCGKNVSAYTVTKDARTAYYISEGTVYCYDGVTCNTVCRLKNACDLHMSFDHVVISVSDDGEHFEYYIYNGALQSVSENADYTGVTRFGVFYICKNEVYMDTEDGGFKTWSQLHPPEEDDTAKSSETAEENDSKKKPVKED